MSCFVIMRFDYIINKIADYELQCKICQYTVPLSFFFHTIIILPTKSAIYSEADSSLTY